MMNEEEIYKLPFLEMKEERYRYGAVVLDYKQKAEEIFSQYGLRFHIHSLYQKEDYGLILGKYAKCDDAIFLECMKELKEYMLQQIGNRYYSKLLELYQIGMSAL